MKKRILLSLLVVPGVFLVLLGCHSKPRVVWDAYLYRHTPVWRLAKAVWQQDTAQIRYLIKEKGMDVNYPEPTWGYTLLGSSVAINALLSTEVLLECGADPNAKIGPGTAGNGSITTPVLIASHYIESHNDPTYLELMLKYGGDPNAYEYGDGPRRNYRTAIGIAGLGGIEYLRPLIEAGADVNFIAPGNKINFGSEAMMNAFDSKVAEGGRFVYKYDAMLYLIEQGGDVNAYRIIEGQEQNLLWRLRWIYQIPLDSEEHRLKMQVVDSLMKRGLNYWEYPVPEVVKKSIMKQHPTDWEEFLQKY